MYGNGGINQSDVSGVVEILNVRDSTIGRREESFTIEMMSGMESGLCYILAVTLSPKYH